MKKTALAKIVSIACAALVTVGFLGGCGNKAPKNATELMGAYIAAGQTNYHVAGNVSLTAGFAGLQLPLDTTIDLDVADQSVHGTVTSSDGASTMEVYSIRQDGKQVTYTKGFPVNLGFFGNFVDQQTLEQWTSHVATLEDANAKVDLTDPKYQAVLEGAQFEATDTGYVLTINGQNVTPLVVDSLASVDGAEQDPAVTAAITEAFNSASVVLTFDKDCHLVAASMQPVTATIQGDNALNLAAQLTVGFDLKMSNIGQVQAITVPDDVVANAVAVDDATMLDQLDQTLAQDAQSTQDAA